MQSVREQRLHDRRLCSLLTSVFTSGGDFRACSAIITDISDTGLALWMDIVPPGNVLKIKNNYFEAVALVHNTSQRTEGGMRLGAEFVAPVLWKRPLPALSAEFGRPTAPATPPHDPQTTAEADSPAGPIRNWWAVVRGAFRAPQKFTTAS